MVVLGGLRRISGAAAICAFLAIGPVFAQNETLIPPAAFTDAIRIAADSDGVIAAFYRDNAYATLWTGPQDQARRMALLAAISRADDHALPRARYDADVLRLALRNAHSEGDRARIEVAMTRAYLDFARDISSGALEPASIDPTIVRVIDRPDPAALLSAVQTADVGQVLQILTPRDPVYVQLLHAKLKLEAAIEMGGWGPALGKAELAKGAKGPAVVALRNRLQAMGYLAPNASAVFDDALVAALKDFQADHGVQTSGKLGARSLAAINISPEQRLKSIAVALERQRWMGESDLGRRHIWVNLTSFMTQIVDDGQVTFETRSVIGKDKTDYATPEFSDRMTHMVVNPSWGVPRSIVVREYLPQLKRNANAVSHIDVVDNRGRIVPRGSVNFASYTEKTFPFAMRQAPSPTNSLGLVKFMFPNKYNIYLHDTPSKSLFANPVRAYSHGCIRLNDPQDFAYVLLAAQTSKGEDLYQRTLKKGKEATLRLDQPVPVHLVYFTAYPARDGHMTYFDDVYGRDAKLYDALESAGMVLPALRG